MRYLIFLILITVSFLTHAEPSRTFSYLMNEPLTLFEWGMYRLEKYTSLVKFKDLDLITSNSNTSYDWEKNRLLIEVRVFLKYGSLKKMPSNEVCKNATNEIREAFSTQYPKEIRKITGISKFFEHEGFVNNSKPNNLMEEVENSTNISIRVLASKTDTVPFDSKVSCESPLMGTDVLIIENR